MKTLSVKGDTKNLNILFDSPTVFSTFKPFIYLFIFGKK